MTELKTKLDALVFGARGALTPNVVDTARQLVVAEGGGPDAVETFRDCFESFQARGYFDARTRKAVDAAYVALVSALPEETPATGGTTEALSARLTALQSLVIDRKTQIAALTTKLATTEAEIEAKSSKATTLLSQKQQYQATLRDKEKQRETLLIFALFGAFGSASAAVGLGSALSINDLRSTIANLDLEIAATQKEKTSLESSLSVYRADQRVRARELSALQAAEKGLAEATQSPDDFEGLAPEQRVASIRGQIDDTQKLASNLRQQIELLNDMNDAASGMSGSLSGIIGALEADLQSLEKRIKASERALMSTIIDLVFKATKTPPNLKIGELSISKKALLLDGLAGLRMELDKQVDRLVNKMITDGLVSAGTAPEVASHLVKLLRGKSTSEPAKSATLSAMGDEARAKLTERQRLVIDTLMNNQPATPEREALIAQIAARPSLTDVQARTISAIALADEGPAGGKSEALASVLGNAALTRRDAGRAILDFGVSTTYGDGAGEEGNDARLGRQASLARRAITMFASDAPAAKALADGLEALDASTNTAIEDHGLMRATLLAGRALATLPAASNDRVALELLRGFRESMSKREGDGAQARSLLDAQRASAALARILAPTDALLTTPIPSDLAGATAWLNAAQATLESRE